ncbi:MAG: Ig-like domain-containing protein [Mycobacterium sp.]|nr:Ig-like domain-containing protein [Mycobacterium sp.]
MRVFVHSVLAVVVVATTVSGGTVGIDTAAIRLPLGSLVESIEPAPGRPVGIAHPVVVTFKRPVVDRNAAELAMDVTSKPAMSGKFEWLDNKVVQWIPDQYWPAHSTISLSVAGKPMALETGPAVVGTAHIKDHTFSVTIDGQTPPDMPAPHHLPHLGEPGVMLASMGRPEYSTPVGKYTVLAKDRTVTMDSSSVGIPVDTPDGYLTKVEYAVRISRRGLYVHSAPWAVESMGFENVSHGCISLLPAEAEWYFNTVNVGDLVIVQE